MYFFTGNVNKAAFQLPKSKIAIWTVLVHNKENIKKYFKILG